MTRIDASALRIDVSQGRYLVWRIVAPNGLHAVVTASEVTATDLNQEDSFNDKVRRGATARTP